MTKSLKIYSVPHPPAAPGSHPGPTVVMRSGATVMPRKVDVGSGGGAVIGGLMSESISKEDVELGDGVVKGGLIRVSKSNMDVDVEPSAFVEVESVKIDEVVELITDEGSVAEDTEIVDDGSSNEQASTPSCLLRIPFKQAGTICPSWFHILHGVFADFCREELRTSCLTFLATDG
jgi:hypothetical protein